jgi:ribosomal protein L14
MIQNGTYLNVIDNSGAKKFVVLKYLKDIKEDMLLLETL